MITRIITGTLLAIVAIGVLFKGGLAIMIGIQLCTLIIAYEYASMQHTLTGNKTPWWTYLIILLITSSLYIPEGVAYWSHPGVKIIAISYWIMMALELLSKTYIQPKTKIGMTIRIIGASVLTLPYLTLLRQQENGLELVLVILVLIWAVDSFAYFGGKAFGKHPLTSLSPKKTKEGTMIGTVITFGIAAALAGYIPLPTSQYIIIVAITVIGAQCGDLHQSLTKRHFGVKDSSNLLPGHGGFYDRLDSTLFIMPILFYYVTL